MGCPDDGAIDGPPIDPEDWTDDEWIAWLKATDDPGAVPASPVTTGSRIVRSSGGAVLGQMMLAMSNAIYGRRDDQVVIVAEGDGEPGDDAAFEVRLDPEHPERSSVLFHRRPHGSPAPPTTEGSAAP